MSTPKNQDPHSDFFGTDFIPGEVRAEKIRVEPIKPENIGLSRKPVKPVKWWQKAVKVNAWKVMVWDELLNEWLETPFISTGETEEEVLAEYDKNIEAFQLRYRSWRSSYQITIEIEKQKGISNEDR